MTIFIALNILVVPMFHCNGWNFTWTIANAAGCCFFVRHVRADIIFDLISRCIIGQSLLHHHYTILCFYFLLCTFSSLRVDTRSATCAGRPSR